MNAPEHLHGIIGETVIAENNAAIYRSHWAVVLGLAPVQDGDHYGIVWGDLPTGVAAFGRTPYEAIVAFDKAMYEAAKCPAQGKANGKR